MIISRKCNKQIPTKTLHICVKNLTHNIINIENLLYLNNETPRINYYNNQFNCIIFPQDTTHFTSKYSQIKFHEES